MPGPGDHEKAGATAGRGRMRASRADREQTIEVLKIAFVQGRLDKKELDTRVSRAFTARTYADLATLTADIPAAPAAASTPRRPVLARARKRTSQKAVVWGLVAGPMACLLVVLVVFGPKLMAGAGILFALSAAMLGGLLVLYSWLDKRAEGEQLPPGAFRGGIGPERQSHTAMSDYRARPGVHPDRPDVDLRAQRSRQHRPDPPRRGIRVPARARPAPGPA